MLVRFCQDKGIAVTAYSSFGALSYVELKMAKIEESAFENQVVKSICGKHGKTPAQVLLRWAVQRGIQVIPKSVKNERLVENFSIDNFTLTEEDME